MISLSKRFIKVFQFCLWKGEFCESLKMLFLKCHCLGQKMKIKQNWYRYIMLSSQKTILSHATLQLHSCVWIMSDYSVLVLVGKLGQSWSLMVGPWFVVSWISCWNLSGAKKPHNFYFFSSKNSEILPEAAGIFLLWYR